MVNSEALKDSCCCTGAGVYIPNNGNRNHHYNNRENFEIRHRCTHNLRLGWRWYHGLTLYGYDIPWDLLSHFEKWHMGRLAFTSQRGGCKKLQYRWLIGFKQYNLGTKTLFDWTIIGQVNGLLPVQHQAASWSNGDYGNCGQRRATFESWLSKSLFLTIHFCGCKQETSCYGLVCGRN